jgi:hypothetical protein
MITQARKRALVAVRDGKCERRYSAIGNTLHGPEGVSANTLWHLVRAGLIDDDTSDRGLTRVRLALTKKGRETIWP